MTESTYPSSYSPPIGFGLSAVTLGAISLLLFFLPILSLPISGAAAIFGVIGVWAALRGGREKLRLSVAGLLLRCAQGIVWGIAIAPSGYFMPRPVFPDRPSIQGRPYVSPPAPPGGSLHVFPATASTS